MGTKREGDRGGERHGERERERWEIAEETRGEGETGGEIQEG